MRFLLSVLLPVMFSAVAHAGCISLEDLAPYGPLTGCSVDGRAEGGYGHQGFILSNGPGMLARASDLQVTAPERTAAARPCTASSRPSMSGQGGPVDLEWLIPAVDLSRQQDARSAGCESGLRKHAGIPHTDKVFGIEPLVLDFQDLGPFASRPGGPGTLDGLSGMGYNLCIGGTDSAGPGTPAIPEPSTLLLLGACLLGLRGLYNRLIA